MSMGDSDTSSVSGSGSGSESESQTSSQRNRLKTTGNRQPYNMEKDENAKTTWASLDKLKSNDEDTTAETVLDNSKHTTVCDDFVKHMSQESAIKLKQQYKSNSQASAFAAHIEHVLKHTRELMKTAGFNIDDEAKVETILITLGMTKGDKIDHTKFDAIIKQKCAVKKKQEEIRKKQEADEQSKIAAAVASAKQQHDEQINKLQADLKAAQAQLEAEKAEKTAHHAKPPVDQSAIDAAKAASDAKLQDMQAKLQQKEAELHNAINKANKIQQTVAQQTELNRNTSLQKKQAQDRQLARKNNECYFCQDAHPIHYRTEKNKLIKIAGITPPAAHKPKPHPVRGDLNAIHDWPSATHPVTSNKYKIAGNAALINEHYKKHKHSKYNPIAIKPDPIAIHTFRQHITPDMTKQATYAGDIAYAVRDMFRDLGVHNTGSNENAGAEEIPVGDKFVVLTNQALHKQIARYNTKQQHPMPANISAILAKYKIYALVTHCGRIIDTSQDAGSIVSLLSDLKDLKNIPDFMLIAKSFKDIQPAVPNKDAAIYFSNIRAPYLFPEFCKNR